MGHTFLYRSSNAINALVFLIPMILPVGPRATSSIVGARLCKMGIEMGCLISEVLYSFVEFSLLV